MRVFIITSLIITFFFTPRGEAQESFPHNPSNPSQEKKIPGIIESLKKMIDHSRESINKTYSHLRTSQQIELNPSLELIKSSEIDPEFLKSLFLYSDKYYTKMINLNKCHLYALIENQLLKSVLGTIDFLIMKSKEKKYLVRYDQFVQQVYKYKCQEFAQFSNVFSRKSLKRTILSLPYPIPKNKKKCLEIIKDWKKNNYLPYLCKIPNILEQEKRTNFLKQQRNIKLSLNQKRAISLIAKDAKFYRKEIPFFQRNYLTNLCKGIEKSQYFCSPYLATDAWSKMLNGELSEEPLSFRCHDLLKKPLSIKLKDDQKNMCAVKLKNSPRLCIDKTTEGYLSLFPRPNCSQISRALMIGNLKTPFHDCPGQVENGGLTNLHRILGHFGDHSVKSDISSCHAETNYTYLKLLLNAKQKEAWPLKACYHDKIEAKEICAPYIPGNLKKSELSEAKVLTKILYKMGQISRQQQCRIVSKKKYRPILLEYKSGCFIIFNEEECSNQLCPKKVFVDEKEVKGVSYKGFIQFDYFANNWKNQKKSIASILESVYKISPTKILNLTQLELFFKKNKEGIAHGIGCIEDILPQLRRRKSFNQCSPTPFIIDGILEIDNNKILTTRTGYDDNLSPRLISWNWIFTAILKYQDLHPLRQWNLFGLKQKEKPILSIPYTPPASGEEKSNSSSPTLPNSNNPVIQIPIFNTTNPQGDPNAQKNSRGYNYSSPYKN